MAHGLDHVSTRMRNTIKAVGPLMNSVMAAKAHNIDLSTAENWLLRPELQEVYSAAVAQNISEKTLSYPSRIEGDTELLASLAAFFDAYFQPRIKVNEAHIVATPGATHCLDALLTTICDDGDSVLVPVPYWNGFGLHFQVRPGVKIVPVTLQSAARQLDETSRPLTASLLPGLRMAMSSVPDRSKVKALVMTNPNNPLGQCYTVKVLQETLEFCKAAGIHYISDELYALSRLGRGEFVSALSLDTPGEAVDDTTDVREIDNGTDTTMSIGSDRKRRFEGADHSVARKRARRSCTADSPLVHVIWSTSKDMCSSGIRMAALISQSPESTSILQSVALLSSMHLSSLSALATTHLLRSPRLPGLISKLSSRLVVAHDIARARFRRWGTPFITADAGPFVLVRLGSKSAGPEIMSRLRAARVMVAAGDSFGSGWCEGDGGFWARLTVAVPPAALWDGLHQIEFALRYTQ